MVALENLNEIICESKFIAAFDFKVQLNGSEWVYVGLGSKFQRDVTKNGRTDVELPLKF